MRIAPFYAVTALVLASCSDPSAQDTTKPSSETVVQGTASSAEDETVSGAMGAYPASQQASGAEQISSSEFNGDRVPCNDERATAEALWEISKRALDKDANLQMVDYGVDQVRLKDGPGKIAAVKYTFEPGDPGVTSTAVDFYLINERCHSKYWRYVE